MSIVGQSDIYNILVQPLTSLILAIYAGIILYKDIKTESKSSHAVLWMSVPAAALFVIMLIRNVGMGLHANWLEMRNFAAFADIIFGGVLVTSLSSVVLFPALTAISLIFIVAYTRRKFLAFKGRLIVKKPRKWRLATQGVCIILLYLSTPLYHMMLTEGLKDFDRPPSSIFLPNNNSYK